jgi:hypothetical protein
MFFGRTPAIDRPIFILGMPRSGTTVIHEAFSARSDIAWFSRPLNRFPRFPVVTVIERLAPVHPALRSSIYRSDQIGPGLKRLRRLERLRLGPTDGINVWKHWFGDRILSDFMLGAKATEAERQRVRGMIAKLLRYEGRERFAAKLTGPGHIAYLSSCFDDALFVHVIRDGRAVVHSLMNFPPWRDTFRAHEPAWKNGVDQGELARWRRTGGSPVALAAIQYRTVIETIREEANEIAPQRYAEFRYEEFLADPHRTLEDITSFCALPTSAEPHAFIDHRVKLRDMNRGWRRGLTEDDLQSIDDAAGDLLAELGYRD